MGQPPTDTPLPNELNGVPFASASSNSYTSRRTLSLDRPPRAPPLRRQSSHLGHPQPVRCWHPDHAASCTGHGEVSAPLPIGRSNTIHNINTSFSFSSSLASSAASTPSSPGWPLASPSTRVFHAYSNEVKASTPVPSPTPTPPPSKILNAANAGSLSGAKTLPPSPPHTPPVTIEDYAAHIADPAPMPKLACVMVGLPARGKTYVGRKVARYLAWLGHRSKIFNVGNYRRDAVGASQPNTFFDPSNIEASKQRTEVALEALKDMINWFEDEGYTSDTSSNDASSPKSHPISSPTTQSISSSTAAQLEDPKPRHHRANSGATAGPGSVAIYDATNSTAERRSTIFHECTKHGIQVMFIESICTSQQMIEDNIREVKISSPDYIGYDPDAAVSDFLNRIRQYEKTYETLSPEECEGHIPYVKLINVGDQVIVNKVRGYLQSRIISFLMNLNITPRSFYFSRHGESMYNSLGRIGGDSDLSPRGQMFAAKLPTLMKEALGEGTECTVWTSTLKRTIQTGMGLGMRQVRWKQLDELDTGLCDGLTYEEIEERWPVEASERDEDKYNFRYHGGESYRDLVARVEPVILELERHHEPNHSILIIGHQAVLRAIYAYFLNLSNEELPYVDIPLHTVVKLTPKAYGCLEERFEVDVPAVDTWRPKGGWGQDDLGAEGVEPKSRSNHIAAHDAPDFTYKSRHGYSINISSLGHYVSSHTPHINTKLIAHVTYVKALRRPLITPYKTDHNPWHNNTLKPQTRPQVLSIKFLHTFITTYTTLRPTNRDASSPHHSTPPASPPRPPPQPQSL
ncbi:Fructose-2,6-bisphosphatase, partial [Rhizophlyctis rosea]